MEAIIPTSEQEIRDLIKAPGELEWRCARVDYFNA